MSLILLKTLHYLAILFAGGVLVGGGLIQAVFARANQVPDINVSRAVSYTHLTLPTTPYV